MADNNRNDHAPIPPPEITLRDDQYISVDDLKSRIADNSVVLIDVRDQWEIKERGKIENKRWINIPWNKIGEQFALLDVDFQKAHCVSKPAPGTEIVIHCRQGRKASHSLTALTELKYENVKSLKGGYEQWSGVLQ